MHLTAPSSLAAGFSTELADTIGKREVPAFHQHLLVEICVTGDRVTHVRLGLKFTSETCRDCRFRDHSCISGHGVPSAMYRITSGSRAIGANASKSSISQVCKARRSVSWTVRFGILTSALKMDEPQIRNLLVAQHWPVVGFGSKWPRFLCRRIKFGPLFNRKTQIDFRRQLMKSFNYWTEPALFAPSNQTLQRQGSCGCNVPTWGPSCYELQTARLPGSLVTAEYVRPIPWKCNLCGTAAPMLIR